MRFRRLLLSGCLLLIAAITVGLASGVLWRLPVRLLTFYHELGFASLFGVGLLLGTFAILAACWVCLAIARGCCKTAGLDTTCRYSFSAVKMGLRRALLPSDLLNGGWWRGTGLDGHWVGVYPVCYQCVFSNITTVVVDQLKKPDHRL
ncbi:hypothetical protein [Loigolactobacillus bifermentans]|uniref:hypothetical protein n=1 Tax=Loigolactobacillus bifermentans TaxID=1607 RepID=UPI00070C18BF|nr:hypothetical protein [Loigolactobacillus bifermentans]QGG61370.1 hypothetical protein LB003_13310 [Loigolactobacillus bifermentans]